MSGGASDRRFFCLLAISGIGSKIFFEISFLELAFESWPEL
jgi:hypothetical protein